jgi:hypothetical protein
VFSKINSCLSVILKGGGEKYSSTDCHEVEALFVVEVVEGVRSEPVVNCVCEVDDKHVEGGRSSSSIDPPAGLLVVLKPLLFEIRFDEGVNAGAATGISAIFEMLFLYEYRTN